jgi:hypothetical protein
VAGKRAYVDRQRVGDTKPVQRFPQCVLLPREGVRRSALVVLVDEVESLYLGGRERSGAEIVDACSALSLVDGPEL